MRIVIGGVTAQDTQELCRRGRVHFTAKNMPVEIVPAENEARFWAQFSPGVFQGAVIGFGDVRGFLCARRVSEEDRDCRLVLMDDTERYAVAGYRLHLADFLLRPCGEHRFLTALDRLAGRQPRS